jgi:hypothetical protein
VTMAPSSGRRWLWSVLQLEDGEEVKVGHPNHQGITWEGGGAHRGWKWRWQFSAKLAMVAVLRSSGLDTWLMDGWEGCQVPLSGRSSREEWEMAMGTRSLLAKAEGGEMGRKGRGSSLTPGGGGKGVGAGVVGAATRGAIVGLAQRAVLLFFQKFFKSI